MSNGLRWSETDLLTYQARQALTQRPGRGQEESKQRPLAEEALLQHIRVVAKRLGFLTYHTRDSRRSDAGWPDLVLCNGHRLIVVEAKSSTGKVTAAQALWLKMLEQTGKVETYVFRPADVPLIETILRGPHV